MSEETKKPAEKKPAAKKPAAKKAAAKTPAKTAKPAAKPEAKASTEKPASVMQTSSSINLLEGTDVDPAVAKKAAEAAKSAKETPVDTKEKTAEKAASPAPKATAKPADEPPAAPAKEAETAKEPPKEEEEKAEEEKTPTLSDPDDYKLPEPAATAAPAPEKTPTAETASDNKKPQPQKRPPKPPKTPEQLAWEAARKEDFNKIVWRPWLWPIVALISICLVTSLLLGVTNMFTAPLIEQNAIVAANKARTNLLPEADNFEELPITVDVEGVTSLYKATNDTGYVIEAYGRGYGGKVPVMVAFNAEGSILGVTFMENDETPGLGQKITEPSFAQQFSNLPGTHLALSDVDKIASATITTGAGIAGVNAAIDLYNAQVLGEGVASSPEEVNAQLLPGETLTHISINAENVLPDAWYSNSGYYIIYGTHSAEYSSVSAAVAISEAGEVVNLWLDTSQENPAYGGLLATNRDFINQFIGETNPVQVDAVADVTGSSTSVMMAVNNALAALPQAKEAK